MTKKFRVDGLDCANCAAKIERAVAALDGVTSANLNFMTGKLAIDAEDAQMDSIVAEAEKIVRKIEPGAVLKKA